MSEGAFFLAVVTAFAIVLTRAVTRQKTISMSRRPAAARPPVMTAVVVQKQMDLRRKNENQHVDLQKSVQQNVQMSAAAAQVERGDHVRRARVQQQHLSEMYQDLQIQRQIDEQQRRQIIQEQDEKLAAELQRCFLPLPISMPFSMGLGDGNGTAQVEE